MRACTVPYHVSSCFGARFEVTMRFVLQLLDKRRYRSEAILSSLTRASSNTGLNKWPPLAVHLDAENGGVCVYAMLKEQG